MRLDHISIAAPKDLLARTRDFYCAVMQLEVGPRPDFGIDGYWLYGAGEAIVHLIESDNHSAPNTPAHLDHIAFCMAGLQAFTRRMDENDVQHSAIPDASGSGSQVFLQDPCGITVEVRFLDEQ